MEELEARQNVESVCEHCDCCPGSARVLGRLWCQSLSENERTNVLIDSQPCRATQHSLLERPTPVAGTARVMGLSLTQLRTLCRLSSKGH